MRTVTTMTKKPLSEFPLTILVLVKSLHSAAVVTWPRKAMLFADFGLHGVGLTPYAAKVGQSQRNTKSSKTLLVHAFHLMFPASFGVQADA